MPHFAPIHRFIRMGETQETIQGKINKFAQFTIACHIAAFLDPKTLPQNVSQQSVVLLFLEWLCEYSSSSTLETTHKLSHSIYDSLFHMCVHILGKDSFLNKWIKLGSYNNRKHKAEQHLPHEFDTATLSVDGTDVRTWLRKTQGQDSRDYYSYKFRKPAYRTQVCVFLYL